MTGYGCGFLYGGFYDGRGCLPLGEGALRFGEQAILFVHLRLQAQHLGFELPEHIDQALVLSSRRFGERRG